RPGPGSSLTELGIPANPQCTQVIFGAFGSGASGSSIISASVLAVLGTPPKESGGTMSSPSQVYRVGISPLWGNAVEVMLRFILVPPGATLGVCAGSGAEPMRVSTAPAKINPRSVRLTWMNARAGRQLHTSLNWIQVKSSSRAAARYGKLDGCRDQPLVTSGAGVCSPRSVAMPVSYEEASRIIQAAQERARQIGIRITA